MNHLPRHRGSVCGYNEPIDEIIGFPENLGPADWGLARCIIVQCVLYHDCIQRRLTRTIFDPVRPATYNAHTPSLGRSSKVNSAGVETTEILTPAGAENAPSNVVDMNRVPDLRNEGV